MIFLSFSSFVCSSTDRVDLARNADRVRSMGITTFAVGVGAALEVELRVS